MSMSADDHLASDRLPVMSTVSGRARGSRSPDLSRA